tara:strand:+ start:278 stop:691 length:414 start_codon:yes stop_codon:yes gene_type:complete
MKQILILLISVILFSCSDGEKKQNNNSKDIIKQQINSEYIQLKNNSKLIGKWKFIYTVKGLEDKGTLIEFYKNNDNYFEVWIEKKSISVKKLTKSGDKYISEFKRKGHYYKINNGELSIYDEKGYIGEEYGFKYIKL